MRLNQTRALTPLLAGALILAALLACDPGGLTGGGAASKLDDVQSATIQVQAEGSFVDPELGTVLNAAGSGSGFIIDPSGLAVTNNHVVTGAALVKVWVGGEQTGELYNARILGVSECSDLAVLDIEGEGFPFLEWYGDDPTVGMEVYAAGFPLGEPEFTLTKGIISKASTSGNTAWASVENALMHDATINPGNSGGPLITREGKVVGVNFMGRPEANQYFAIAASEARPVVDQLRAGEDYLSVGINGTAVQTSDISGLWVSSVESGSPADQTGIRPGDLLLTLESLVLATDGSMLDYCDILKSHTSSDILDVGLVRFSTGEVLDGQLNGRPVEVAGTLPSGASGSEPPPDSGGRAAVAYVPITDDYAALLVEVPSTWTDVNTRPWIVGGETVGSQVMAAEDKNTFVDYSGPGMILSVTREFDRFGGINGILGALQDGAAKDCVYDNRYDYRTPIWQGKFDAYLVCGGYDTIYLALAAEPVDHLGGYLAVLQVQVPTKDLGIFDYMSGHFTVIGTLP